MSRKNIILVLCLLVLGSIYFYFFTDWFAASDIQISQTIRPNRMAGRRMGRRSAPPAPSHTVSFAFNQRLRLSEVQVIPASDMATNKYPHPIWHLVSDSNSVPVKSLVYGMPIRGMRPSVKDAWPDPLQPSTEYKLYLKTDAGSIDHPFKTPPSLPAPK